jgi:hypothetical protein
MKITNWRRKLAATLLGCGLISPAQALAAELDTNLVVNPGFENVDTNIISAYFGAPLILDWQPSTFSGYAYSHDYNTTGVPNFSNGSLPSGGLWYFTPGNQFHETYTIADAIFQDIDVSGGDTGAVIADGAKFSLSAFFSTYADQADRGFVRAEFFNGQTSLGMAEVSTPLGTVLQDWTQFSTTGAIPLGTQRVRMYSWGEIFVGSTGSADGYTDNIDFRILPGLASDFDNDGDSDGADFLRWQRGVGTTGAAATKNVGNANADNIVDGADLDWWEAEYGLGGSAVASIGAVPEPASIVLVGVGLATLGASARRRSTPSPQFGSA